MLYFIYLLFRNGSKDEIVESNQNDTAVTNDEKETIGAEDIKTIRDESSNNSIIKTSSGRNLEENVIAVANNKYQLDDSIIGMYINFRNFRTRKKVAQSLFIFKHNKFYIPFAHFSSIFKSATSSVF